MAGVTISSAVRTNLLSLQNISAGQSAVQNRLATGKKVNSALDNATSFFTASSFQSRASSLSSLLDSVSTGVQTLQAANNGITSITSLVNQLRSTAQQALQSTSAYSSQAKISSSAITGATSADLRGTNAAATATSTGSISSLVAGAKGTKTSTATLAGASLTTATKSTATSANNFSDLDTAVAGTADSTNNLSTVTDTTRAKVGTGTATAITDLTSGTTSLTVSDGTTSKSFTYDTSATSGDANKFRDLADLNAKLKSGGLKVTAAFDGGSSVLAFTADGSVGTLTVTSADAAVVGSGSGSNTSVQGGVLTISDGSLTKSFTRDTNASADDNTRFKDAADLNTKLGRLGVKAAAELASSKLRLTATDTKTTLTVTGSAATSLGNLSSIAPTGGDTLLIDDGKTGKTFTYATDATDADADRFKDAADLNKKLAQAGIKAKAELDGTKLKLTATEYGTKLAFGGSGLTDLGSFTPSTPAGDILKVNDGSGDKSFFFKSDSAADDTSTFKDIDDLNTKLTTLGVKAKAESVSGKLKLSATDYATTLTVSGTAADKFGGLGGAIKATGDNLTINDGSGAKSFVLDANSAADDLSSFKDTADLNTKLTKLGVKAKAEDVGGKLKLTASDNTTSLTVGGTAQGASKLNIKDVSTSTNALDGKTLSFALSGGATTTVTFGDPAVTAGAIKSLDDLNAKLADAGLAASLDSAGNLAVSTNAKTASQTFTVGGTATTGTDASFKSTTSSAATRGGSGADSRDSLVTQFNGLLDQINTVAKDSNFNGLNLLNGDTLSLIFNETNSSKLDVNGTSANSSGLGLNRVAATDFNDGNGINTILTAVDKAKSALATQASKFGSNLAVVQTRQDFTKNTINTLNTGSDNLVNADLNEEATNLLSLNTSQSLAQQALSLANQSQQSVLQLLR